MKNYTERELYAFVYRANTLPRIAAAEDWLKRHVNDIELFNDLMVALTEQYREVTTGTRMMFG